MKKIPWILLGVLITAIPTALAASYALVFTQLFTDVTTEDWYGQAVKNLRAVEVIEGYEDDTFRPGNNINRAEMAIILDRFSDVIRNGCIKNNKFYLNGDIIKVPGYQKNVWCQDGVIFEDED